MGNTSMPNKVTQRLAPTWQWRLRKGAARASTSNWNKKGSMYKGSELGVLASTTIEVLGTTRKSITRRRMTKSGAMQLRGEGWRERRQVNNGTTPSDLNHLVATTWGHPQHEIEREFVSCPIWRLSIYGTVPPSIQGKHQSNWYCDGSK